MNPSDEKVLVGLLENPRRRAVLRALLGSDAPRSPVEMAEDLGEPLPDLTYHVRVLRDAEALQLDGTEESRGCVKHLYVPGPLVERNRDLVTVLLATG